METPLNGTTVYEKKTNERQQVSPAMLLDSVPALIAYVDKHLCYQYVNSAYEKWLGRKADAIIGKKITDVLGAETLKTVTSQINSVLSGQLSRFEYSAINKQGLRYVDVCYTPDFADDGSVRGYTVHINDITDKKDSERKLRDYVENATIAMHWVDKDGVILWANDAELKMLGYPREEYIGHHISEFHAKPEVINDILTRLSCNESLHEYEAVLKCKDGSLRTVAISSNVLSENGEFIHTRCFTVDITQRKLAERALKESEGRYRRLIDSLPVAFYACDTAGRITYYNDVAVKLWGYAPPLNDDSQKFCAFSKVYLNGTFIPPEQTPMAIAVQTGASFRDLEPVFVTPDGKSFNACVNIDPIFDAEEKLCGAINVFQDVTKLKATETALRESEAKYRSLVELLPTAIYTCDPDGRIDLFNKAAADLWGRNPEVGKDMWCGSWKIFNPEDGSPVPLDTCPMAVALKEGRPVRGKEIVVERPDGLRRNVAPHPTPILDTAGNIIGAVNLLIDITDQKLASQALRASEEQFRMIANLIPIVIWMSDSEGKWNYVNPQWQELTGTKPEDCFGYNWMNLIHPDELENTFNAWASALSDRSPFIKKFRYASGRGDFNIVQANARPRYNERGEFSGYLGILQDVTIQEQIKDNLEKAVKEKTADISQRTEDLRKSEERYHRMIDEVQDYAIILLSRDGKIENWNKGAEKIKGYQADEILGQSFKRFYTEEDQKSGLPDKLIKKAVDEGKAVQEGWRVRKDGSRFWASVVITALHNEQNEVVGFSKVTRDLTARKAAEDELKAKSIKLEEKNIQLERLNKDLEKMNQELASFAYISSHDLQEPLRKIQSFSSRILELEEKNFSEKSKDYFNRIQGAAQRMRHLIEDLLSYSQANTSERKFVPVDLNQILQEVEAELKEVIEAKSARIVSSPLPTLNVIPFQFHQLLVNILANSMKFSKPGTTPEIYIDNDMVKGAEIQNAAAMAEKTYHVISIKDNGIGFDPAYNVRIFEIFQRLHNRRDYEGTGVGLAICKKIVENHNGIITADGKINEGAIFNIYLPA
ncbi:MAG TPA: PAS domain S-box protein [Chryseosolibacter sp.]|nr:PAS domain S-box protein [Chryseosolibacter sp.]